ncbi:MAG: hypothetical protein QOD75_1078 [Blastocatellia bacterium]|nr:hypothetical protein [Blastocatellia bacterium]
MLVVVLLTAAASFPNAGQEVAPTPAPQPESLRFLPPSVLNAKLREPLRRRHRRAASFKLSDDSGKVIVLNLWATWCGPCRLETPALVQLHKEFRSQDLQIVALTTENPRLANGLVRDWIRNFRVPYRVGFVSSEVAWILMQEREVIPQSFVISRSGRIVKRSSGSVQR